MPWNNSDSTMIKSHSILVAVIGLALTATVSCKQIPTEGHGSTGTTARVHIAWDWTGIIGTGQSLEVGQYGTPVGSTNQPYHNLKLATGNLVWPIDPDNPELKLVSLVEPIGRRGFGGWPTNIAGETPHSAMANELSALVKEQFGRDFITVHTEVGENGKGIQYIKKNPTPRGNWAHAYEGSMVETKAITRLAKAAGKAYGVAAIIVTHGESDSGSSQYENALHQLWQDYNTDIPAITGQTNKILMILSQQHGIGNHSPSTIAQWKMGVDYPDDFVCSGPKYQYRSPDSLHLTTEGYQEVGEKYAQVYYQRVILGNHWLPLEAEKVTRKGRTIVVQFHVPVEPLAWDANLEAPHATLAEWKNGKGFEVTAADGQKVTINSTKIKGDAVVITCATDPGANARVSYALYGEGRIHMSKPYRGFPRWGLLHDSDPFKGTVTAKSSRTMRFLSS